MCVYCLLYIYIYRFVLMKMIFVLGSSIRSSAAALSLAYSHGLPQLSAPALQCFCCRLLSICDIWCLFFESWDYFKKFRQFERSLNSCFCVPCEHSCSLYAPIIWLTSRFLSQKTKDRLVRCANRSRLILGESLRYPSQSRRPR